MKYYYGRDNTGKLVRLAKIYTKDEHGISKNAVAQDAAWIVRTLESKGHHAYVVGGAIRDFLSNKVPKDFDIVTDAHPRQVKKYFHRSRIVGKRFPIVLISFSHRDYIEVSTFRAEIEKQIETKKKSTPELVADKMEYGSIDQDVKRRDFTCNALYYNLQKEEIIDFVDGVEHLQEKKLVPIRTEFQEDPVRMLRALKYSAKVDLSIPYSLQRQIKKNAELLGSVSSSRIGDEIMKILLSGVSEKIIRLTFAYGLIEHLLPQMYEWYKKDKNRREILFQNLAEADAKIEEKYSRIRGIELLVSQYVKHIIETKELVYRKGHLSHKSIMDILVELKKFLYPITPPNSEIQKSLISILRSEKLVSSHFREISFKPVSNRSKK